MSKSCQQKKPPVTNQPPGYDEVKQKLDKIGWSEVDPKQYVMKNRVKEDLFGDQYYERDGQEITFKIYMSNVQPNQTWSRIADQLNIGNFPFGTCHAGLQVGSKTVNWYDSSLVTIGDFGASSGFILFSPNENLAVKLSNNLMDKLADLIIKWNINMTYSKLQNNCQAFVQEFLAVIGLSMPTGPLGKLIKSIREGNTKRRIETKYCGVLEFETHDELDRLEPDHSDPNLPMDKKLTSEEKKILKLFHRGFQMQERAQEPMPRRQFSCPAGEDPTGLPSNRGTQEQEII